MKNGTWNMEHDLFNPSRVGGHIAISMLFVLKPFGLPCHPASKTPCHPASMLPHLRSPATLSPYHLITQKTIPALNIQHLNLNTNP